MKLKIVCHLQKDSSGLSSKYCGPRRHEPPLQAPALPRSWNVIASLCKGSSQWVNKFWDPTVLSCCMEKMCCKRWKHQKSNDCETGKRGIILGERVADLPFPTLSALCPPICFLTCWVHVWSCDLLPGSSGGILPSLVLRCLSWLFHPQHSGEETQKGSAGSPGLSPYWEGTASKLVEGAVGKLTLDTKPGLSNWR